MHGHPLTNSEIAATLHRTVRRYTSAGLTEEQAITVAAADYNTDARRIATLLRRYPDRRGCS